MVNFEEKVMKKVFLLSFALLAACSSVKSKNGIELTSIDDGNILVAVTRVKNSQGEIQEYISYQRSWAKEFFDLAKNAAIFTPVGTHDASATT